MWLWGWWAAAAAAVEAVVMAVEMPGCGCDGGGGGGCDGCGRLWLWLQPTSGQTAGGLAGHEATRAAGNDPPGLPRGERRFDPAPPAAENDTASACPPAGIARAGGTLPAARRSTGLPVEVRLC